VDLAQGEDLEPAVLVEQRFVISRLVRWVIDNTDNLVTF
jgi:hypothetical protein